MSFQTHKGSFGKTTSGAPVSQSITGIPFLPKALIIWGTANAVFDFTSGNQQLALGFTDGTGEQCIHASSENFLFGGSDADRRNLSTKLLTFLDFTQTVIAECDLTSFNDNGGGDFGFTINWTTNNGVAYKIHYLALGGDDLTDVKVASFDSATSTGDQDVTGVGFQPDAVLFINSFQSAFGTVAGGSFGLGMAVSAEERGTVAISEENGQSPTNTARYQRPDRCIAMLGDDAALKAEADFVSMASDGFTVDWLTADGTARKIGYLALKGGRYSVGSETQKTSTGTKDTLLEFEPKGLLLAGFNNVASASVVAGNTLTIGGASAVGQEGMAWGNVKDNVTLFPSLQRSSINSIIEHRDASDLNASATLSSLASDKFVLDWETADGTAREFLYFAFGDIGVPHISKGTFIKDTGGAPVSQDIALPFDPQALILWATPQTSEGAVLGARFTYGFSDGTNHYSVAGSTEDDVDPSDADHRHASKALTFIDNTPTVLAECDVSFGTRKFTVTWTTNNDQGYIIHYLAIGGIEDAKVGVFNGGDTLGNQSITGVGFQPSIEFFASAHVQADPPGSGDDISMMMGAAISADQRAVVDLVEHDDLDTVYNSERMTSAVLCLLKISQTPSVETTEKEADFVSQDSDGFTIDWGKVNTGLDRFGYLALRGANYEIGIGDIPTSTGEVETTLDSVINPRGVLFFHVKSSSLEAIAPPALLSLSAGTRTSFQGEKEGFAGWSVFDGINITESSKRTGTDRAISYNQAGTAGAADAAANLTEFSASSFTLDWVRAGTVLGKYVFVAFGEPLIRLVWFDVPAMVPTAPDEVVSYG